MILIALGGNLDGPWGGPAATLDRACSEFEAADVRIRRRSSWYRSAPFGYVHQPSFVNGVIAVDTELSPLPLLALCHRIERRAGRRRDVRWGPRSLDLDLVAYRRVVSSQHLAGAQSARGRRPLLLPHPGVQERPFVLVPIAEIAPRWRHPVTGATANQMLRALGSRARGGVLERISCSAPDSRSSR